MEIAGSYWETLLSFTINLLVKGGRGGGENRRKIDSVSYPTLNNINCSEL